MIQGVDAIQKALFGIGVNSTNRLETMLRLVVWQPPQVFWPVFIDAWDCCDATWWCRSDLLIYLRRHHAADPGPGYLQERNREFFNTLPDRVEVFRGCSRPRVRGLSWTTDRGIAEGFARGHRGIGVPMPVIARAVIPKGAIFAALAEREENEIVLDPRRLRRLAVLEQAAPS